MKNWEFWLLKVPRKLDRLRSNLLTLNFQSVCLSVRSSLSLSVFIVFLKGGEAGLFFIYFRRFSHRKSNINWKGIDDVLLGDWTCGRRMVGADRSSELCGYTIFIVYVSFSLSLSFFHLSMCLCFFISLSFWPFQMGHSRPLAFPRFYLYKRMNWVWECFNWVQAWRYRMLWWLE